MLVSARTTVVQPRVFNPALNLKPPRHRDAAIALVCAIVVIALLLAAGPFGGLPFNDDPSYVFTAKRLAETGHLHFNGWAAAALGPQAYWAALLIKLFGFSFTVVRLGTLPVAGACAAVAYRLARRCNLQPRLAVLSAAALFLSPLFLPLATSFMTDIYGLLFALLALDAVLAAGLAHSATRAMPWIAGVVALVLVGGTVRQIVWVVAIAGLPAVAWKRRGEAFTVIAAVAGFVAVGIGAWLTLRWLAAQPYTIAEDPILHTLLKGLHQPAAFFGHIWGLLLTFVLVTLPLLMIGLGAGRRLAGWQWILALLVLGAMLLARRHWVVPPSAPWIGNTLTYYGLFGVQQMGPGRPPTLPGAVWAAVSFLVYALFSLAMAVAIGLLPRVWHRRQQLWTQPTDTQWIIATLLLFAAGYFALLLPRCVVNQMYDRYLLPLIPCVSIPVLLAYQHQPPRAGPLKRSLMPAACFALLMLALLGWALTQDDLALGRARVAAIHALLAAGIAPNHIDGGFDFNLWTQLELTGHVNDSRIKLPAHAYDPSRPVWPDFSPAYRVEFSKRTKSPDEAETRFPPVHYWSALPPFHRTLIVRQVVAAAPKFTE